MSDRPAPNGDSPVQPLVDDAPGAPAVRGLLHRPATPGGDLLVLTHGAGSNREAPLLVGVARAFAARGVTVLRCDLPFRQARPTGPPPAGAAERDRAGLRRAVELARRLAPGRVFLGGHSYGGRQASLLAADERGLVEGLLLLAYPLHPPRRPDELRTAHFPRLATPTLFVHGERDPFGTLAEVEAALRLLSAPTALLAVEGAGHDLVARRRGRPATMDVGTEAATALLALVGPAGVSSRR